MDLVRESKVIYHHESIVRGKVLSVCAGVAFWLYSDGCS